MKKLAVVGVTAAVLAGCQTTNPYTGQQETNKTSTYGGVGAIAGAVIGGLVDGEKGALRGAALGAAAGAGYGYYTDQQEAALRQELQGTGVRINRYGNDIQLVMPSNITFGSNQSAIKSSFYPVLVSVSKVFKRYDKNLIEIIGYTDSTGSPSLNQRLSTNRAKSVARYFEYQGVSSTRVTYFGEGASNPIGNNKTKAGRAMNRRVEINLKPAPQR
ncbi:hypothetical protein EOPP23_10765 [Endozoicomonas sp. OPT23]|nr:hypothetical protein [Endozoicomonas sp. OPT23]